MDKHTLTLAAGMFQGGFTFVAAALVYLAAESSGVVESPMLAYAMLGLICMMASAFIFIAHGLQLDSVANNIRSKIGV